jgi:hypothetical protein
MSSTTRRKFLAAGAGVAAASGLGMPGFVTSALAQTAPPKRLMLLFMPNSNLRDLWLSTGGRDAEAGTGDATQFTLNRLAAPLEPIRQYMTILHGVNMDAVNGDQHSSGQIRVTTGADVLQPNINGGPGNLPTAPSLDTIAAMESPVINAKATRFLQLVMNADTRSPSLHHQCITSDMMNNFIAPDNVPMTVYSRIFAGVTPGGMVDQTALLKLRARKKSVIDFLTADLNRLNARVPAAQRIKLESHLEGIRALEKSLDAQVGAGGATVTLPMGLETLKPNTSANHPQLVQGFFDITKTAFQLDLTRIASYAFATGNSAVSFADFNAGPSGGVHNIAHQSKNDMTREALATVTLWYTTKIAQWVQQLAAIPEGNGTLLDNTLIYFFAETAQYHEHNDIPIVLIGGKNLGNVGNRCLRYNARQVNDISFAILKQLGVNRTTFGDARWFHGLAPGLFA